MCASCCAQPLPLALDFSAARLSAAQRRWLLDPAQAGRVEAASFHPMDALWWQVLLNDFLSRHGRTLLHLSGVPLRLVTCASLEERPALDLSGLRLTRLGVDSCDTELLQRMHSNGRMHLWPERLPGTLEELHLLGPGGYWFQILAWAPHFSAGLAGRLPRLRTVRVTRLGGRHHLSIDEFHLLEGCPVLPAFELHTSEVDIIVGAKVFGRVGHVRVVSGGHVFLWGSRDDVALFVDRLCPAGLQAAELCAKKWIDMDPDEGPLLYEVVRKIISRHGDCFAVEVVTAKHRRGDEQWDKVMLRRLAWRRWLG